MENILLICAHPDDEVLGLGGTMHRLVSEGKDVHVIILGEGITSRADTRDPEKWDSELKKHHSNINTAKMAIGFSRVSTYNFPDNRFDTVALLDIIKIIEKEAAKIKPDTIFTHHGGDTNIDHRRTFEAVMAAFRPMKDQSVQTIYCFETPSSTEWQSPNIRPAFLPNVYFRITEEDLEAKIMAMEAYEYERREFPHPRSPEALRALATLRGVQIGASYAEAFVAIRDIK